MTTGPLAASVQVTLGATGAGSGTLGPGRQSETWHVTRMTTRGTSATEPVHQVLRGSAMLDTTPRGNADVSESVSGVDLQAGESLTATYSGGTAGAVMTFYVEGTVDYGV